LAVRSSKGKASTLVGVLEPLLLSMMLAGLLVLLLAVLLPFVLLAVAEVLVVLVVLACRSPSALASARLRTMLNRSLASS
jgi:hypothetical protein